MMTVSDKSANVEFTVEEYDVLNSLTSERMADMKNKLKSYDPHKYIKMRQLNAKLESVLSMIEYEKKQKEEQKVIDKITQDKLSELEDIEDCTHRVG
jgi:hypothetical protein